MRFGLTAAQKRERAALWKYWWAWYPVRLCYEDFVVGPWIWLEPIAYKSKDDDNLSPWLRVPWVDHCRMKMEKSRA
jgi:hypothetical protein